MKNFIHKRLISFKPALNGIIWLFSNEGNAMVHLFATFVVVIAGWFFELNTIEWIIVTLTISAVIAAEAFNTAIEKTIDLLHPQKHAKAGLVKDLAAAGVLITSIAAVIVGALIFMPKFF
ncbi:MAG: diacylglycerol kinase family protein [Bacteroidota bacterium]